MFLVLLTIKNRLGYSNVCPFTIIILHFVRHISLQQNMSYDYRVRWLYWLCFFVLIQMWQGWWICCFWKQWILRVWFVKIRCLMIVNVKFRVFIITFHFVVSLIFFCYFPILFVIVFIIIIGVVFIV